MALEWFSLYFPFLFPFSSNDIGFGLQVQQFWSHAHYSYAKMLLTSPSPQYDNLITTLYVGKEILKLEDVTTVLLESTNKFKKPTSNFEVSSFVVNI